MWKQANPNPKGLNVGDCVIRAICMATGKTWGDVYMGVVAEGYRLCDMPSANRVWGSYLTSQGFERHGLPETCPACYTVADFAKDHPNGTFILALDGHVVAIQNGNWLDTWDSKDRAPMFYWQRGEKKKEG